MRFVLCVSLLLNAVIGSSQELEFRDYRTKKESFNKVPEKDVKAELAAFTMAGIEESIAKLTMPKIPATSFGNNFMKWEGNNIKVSIETGRFDPSKYKLTKDEEHIVKINNKAFYGNYGEMPSNHIQTLTVIIDKDTIPIPPTAYMDLCNVNFSHRDASGTVRSNNAVYYIKDNRRDRVYIYLLNRDGAGGYEATWVIQDKKYLRRVLDYGFIK